MKKTCLVYVFLFPVIFAFGQKPTMQGLAVGDEFWNKRDVHLPVEAYEELEAGSFMVKYRTGNGNPFHVTTSSERVVYMENNWSGRKLDRRPLYTNFIFDQTSLQDIYNALGSKGFRHIKVDGMQDDEYFFMICSYEFADMQGVVISFATRVAKPNNDQVVTDPRKFKLMAVALMDENYQKELWGFRTETDVAYRPINARLLGW